MKNISRILIVFLFALSISVNAQNPRRDKIKALKTAHVTNALDLSADEAQQFWPIYNEFEKKLETLRKNEMQQIREKFISGIDNLSDKEANDLIDASLKIKRLELEEREILVKKLRAVISPKKILKLKKAEDEFRKILFEQIKKHRKRGRP